MSLQLLNGWTDLNVDFKTGFTVVHLIIFAENGLGTEMAGQWNRKGYTTHLQ